jgi:hypothetical protein
MQQLSSILDDHVYRRIMQRISPMPSGYQNSDRTRLLQILVRCGEDYAREVLVKQRQDSLPSIFHAVDGFDHHYLITPLNDNVDTVGVAIKASLADINAKAYSFICTAWEESKTDDNSLKDPNPRETVFILATDGMNSRVSVMLVSRRKDGKVKQLKKTPMSIEHQTAFSGGFADLLVRGSA